MITIYSKCIPKYFDGWCYKIINKKTVYVFEGFNMNEIVFLSYKKAKKSAHPTKKGNLCTCSQMHIFTIQDLLSIST